MITVKMDGSFDGLDPKKLIGNVDVKTSCKKCGHELLFKIKDVQRKSEVTCPKCKTRIPVQLNLK